MIEEDAECEGDLTLDERVFVRLADPADTDLDRFACGVDEVDEFFQSRKWFNEKKGKAAPTTYQFLTEEGGDVLGYASATFGNYPHPSDDSPSKAKYLVVWAAGLHRRFHGQSTGGGTYAEAVFQELEELAMKNASCVGLSLWVRTDNPRAIRFYEKFGFVADAGGGVQRSKDGAPHLTMRKLFAT